MISATKKIEISYAHTLPEHQGECKNLHGHNALIEVEIGVPEHKLPSDGMVTDFADLNWRAKQDILDKLDHRYLNDVLPEEYLPPTAENVILWIKSRLVQIYKSKLIRIRLYESERNWAEWKQSE